MRWARILHPPAHIQSARRLPALGQSRPKQFPSWIVPFGVRSIDTLAVQLSGKGTHATVTGTSQRASVRDTSVWQFAFLPGEDVAGLIGPGDREERSADGRTPCDRQLRSGAPCPRRDAVLVIDDTQCPRRATARLVSRLTQGAHPLPGLMTQSFGFSQRSSSHSPWSALREPTTHESLKN